MVSARLRQLPARRIANLRFSLDRPSAPGMSPLSSVRARFGARGLHRLLNCSPQFVPKHSCFRPRLKMFFLMSGWGPCLHGANEHFAQFHLQAGKAPPYPMWVIAHYQLSGVWRFLEHFGTCERAGAVISLQLSNLIPPFRGG